ncbi:type IX secretion system protein PorQ [Mesohalobacter halotolerans]|uniref:Type IX secretion system protein PorQ n=1 Tax=Mesohalobacter halotolerans TaxID=1883405 RepID=A0A4U5TPC8_9FLAO|nr:type IX secretion system protein PorQ [Mesohalobacter halotolerans]MBS3739157.1 type IX secretion system protein PorQ [Psychroflexus sp.]TKS55957.1 type IX secretion system protein PorQ [Mesohalobacter halotolerans]
MHLKARWFCSLIFLIPILASAQIGGQNTYQFLNLPVSPRHAALGGKNVTLNNYDPSSALNNPALINYKMDNQLAVNYMNFVGDINYGTASYAYLFDRRTRVLQAGITYINYGSFDGFDENANSTGTFTGNEAALSIGYQQKLGRSDFHLGANVKFITSKLENFTSFGIASDIGLSYKYDRWNLIVSGVVRNLGYQIKPFNEIREDLPLEVVLGVSQKFRKLPFRWHITIENVQEWDIAFGNSARDEVDLNGNVTEDDPGFFANITRRTILGIEFFPDSGFNIQLGYNLRRAEELRIEDQRSFAGLSGGLSIKFNKVRINYSYTRFNRAANTSFFGVSIDLSR